MPDYASSITVDQIIDALADFITPFVTPAQIVRAQTNRVPMPAGACVVLTEIGQYDLAIPYENFTPTSAPIPAVGTTTINGPARIEVQADFYGPQSGEWVKVVMMAFRSAWAYDRFPQYVKPLYTSDALQAPLITAEQQYESRWTLTAAMQYNPIVNVPQEFATTLGAHVAQADN